MSPTGSVPAASSRPLKLAKIGDSYPGSLVSSTQDLVERGGDASPGPVSSAPH